MKQKMTQIGENVAESPCAKKARIGIPPVWSNAENTLQSPAANLNSILFSPSPSPGMRKGRSHVMPHSDEVKVENEKLIAAVASPMRRRCSLGTEDVESDAVESCGRVSNFEAKLNAATALSFEGAPPVKKARLEDCPSANNATPQASKRELLTPASAVPWTPDQRVLLREKIQALRLLSNDRATSPSPSSDESSPRSSRSASPRTSRSASPQTPERARLFHGASPPQKRKDDSLEVDYPPPPPPGSPDCDGASVPPPPPPGSPGCDGACVPPPPPPGSPSSDTMQPAPPSPTTPVRRRCVWPEIRAEKASSASSETASDVEADIRRLIALHAVSNVFADSIFA